MDGAELKRTYRILAKRLHPDVRGANNEERSALFVLAQSAYRNGDVEALHSLEVATRHMDAAENDLEATDDVELLAQELELVRIEEGVVRERLNNLERGPELRLVVHDRQGSREQGLRLARSVDYRPAEGAYYEQNGTQLRMALRSRE